MEVANVRNVSDNRIVLLKKGANLLRKTAIRPLHSSEEYKVKVGSGVRWEMGAVPFNGCGWLG